MQLAQYFTLLELLFVSAHCVSDIAWIPLYYFELWYLFGFVVLFQLFLHVAFCEFLKPDYFFHELFTIQLIAEALVIWESWVNAEYNGKLLFHGSPKHFELFLWQAELYFIELSENLIIFRYRLNVPLFMNFFVSILPLVITIR